MPNKNYDRGRAFEYSVMNKLKDIGIPEDSMIRSAGSHGPIDIIVWKETEKLIDKYPELPYYENDLELFGIQCKHSIKSDADLKALFSEQRIKDLAAMPDKFIKVLCIKQPRTRKILQFVYNGYEWKLKTVFQI